MSVKYNIHRNEITYVMFIEVYIMAIVWSFSMYVFILRYQYIMYICTDL